MDTNRGARTEHATGAGPGPTGTDQPAGVLRIDCDECSHQGTATCDDCLVTFLCEREHDGAVVIPLEEVRAVRLLQGAGMAPRVRHRRRVG